MGLSLREFKIRNCEILIQKLLQFKESIKERDIETTINDLHTSFLVFSNSFEINPIPNTLNYSETGSKIKNIKIDNMELLVCDDLVIDIDDSHSPVAVQFVNKTVTESKELSLLFFDYKDRCCDFCGQYFTKYTFLTPERRLKMEDFALAYHPCCYKESIVDFYHSSE